MKKQFLSWFFPVPIFWAMLCAGCNPSGGAVYSTKKVPNLSLFPFICSDATYTSYVNVFNRSDYKIDANYTYRDAKGTTISTKKTTVNPHAGERSTQANFTGSVSVYGEGEEDALFCMIEIRKNNGMGAALAEPALNPYTLWFYHLGVKDYGPGKDRTTLVTYNFSTTESIYVEYGWGAITCSLNKQEVAAYQFEVKIPPQGFHSFRPYDQYAKEFEGIVYAQAMSGPKQTGKQVSYHTGALFREGLSDIALTNYKPPHYPYACAAMYPKGYEEWYEMYFADVQDDGVNRADRIHLKSNDASNYNQRKYVPIPIYFYEKSGKTLSYPTASQVKLINMFDLQGSYQVVSPMKLLGTKFSGSVWIDNPYSLNGRLEASICREAPNKWIDWTDYSPPAGSWQGYNCLPYVSNNDGNWIYQIVLFYPERILKSAPPAPKDLPPSFSGPTIKVPSNPGGGYVYVKFYDLTGKYKGTFAFKMNANETLYKPLNDPSITAYISDFQGGLIIEPRDVIVQLELQNKSGTCHASTGNWYSAKSH